MVRGFEHQRQAVLALMPDGTGAHAMPTGDLVIGGQCELDVHRKRPFLGVLHLACQLPLIVGSHNLQTQDFLRQIEQNTAIPHILFGYFFQQIRGEPLAAVVVGIVFH